MKLGHIAVAGLLVAAAGGASVLSSAVASPSGQSSTVRPASPHDNSLRALAARVGLRIGNAVNMDVLGVDAQYTDIAGSQFSSSTPENVMKWQPVEPTQGQYNWAPADGLVAFADQHGQRVRGHTLVWHNQLPAWLTGGTFTNDQLRDLLHKHITDEVTHFKGKIWQWDVVNEAFNDDGTMRDTIWLRDLGPGYIADAFRWAHEADPKALLFYNDYNIEGFGPKSDAAFAMVKQLRATRRPDQRSGHSGSPGHPVPDPSQMTQNAQRFADLGLYVAYTEADVRMFVPATPASCWPKPRTTAAMLQSCLLVSRCISYTVWGFTDKYSWVPGVFAGEGAADLYDENYNTKPAYDAVQQTLALASEAPRR